ncbi:MAG: hypothetical protein IKU39_00300 [Lachnospiraceae bacterium]|nr:hypothetical protein [Lachnospiraceae bacterium]
MKKKLLVILVALMCIMLCACGSSETNNTESNTENIQNNIENSQDNSEVATDEAGFSIVGEWKIESSDSPVTFKEDGTFESYLGDGFEYEDKSASNIISIDIGGFGFAGAGMQDFEIVEENGNYKLVCKDIVLVQVN